MRGVLVCTQINSWMTQVAEATITCSRKGTDVTEMGSWESSGYTLHSKPLSENLLEDIWIFMISLCLYLGLRVQEVRGQLFLLTSLP